MADARDHAIQRIEGMFVNHQWRQSILQGRCTAIAPATPYAVTHNPRTHRLWVQMDLGSANLKPNPSDSSVEISGLVGMIHGNLHADSYEY